MHTDLRISLCATAVAEPTKSTHQRLSRQSFSLCNPARTPRGIPIRLAALRVVVFGFHFTFPLSLSLFLSVCVYEKQLALFIIVIISTATSTTWSDLCFFHPVASYDGYGYLFPLLPLSPIPFPLCRACCRMPALYILADATPSTCSSSSSRRHLTLPAVCLFYLITSQGDRAHNTALIYFN